MNQVNSRWSSEELRNRVIELFEAGKLISEIGKTVGVSKNTITGWLYRNGYGRVVAKLPSSFQGRITKLSVFPAKGLCLWPHGHPGELGFYFCGREAAMAGAPYCPAHMRLAYQRAQQPKPAEERDAA